MPPDLLQMPAFHVISPVEHLATWPTGPLNSWSSEPALLEVASWFHTSDDSLQAPDARLTHLSDASVIF